MTTSPCLLHLTKRISFLKLPITENNGTYKYSLKYFSFRSMYHTTTNYEDLTRYLLHYNTGLHAASNIKPSSIVNITSQII